MTEEVQYAKGYIPRNYDTHPLGNIVGAPRFTKPLITDPQEIKQRIAEKTANKSWIMDVIQRAGMNPKNQNPFSWCHAAAIVAAAQVNRLLAGFPLVEYSIASVAGPVTGWRDQGAAIFQDNEFAQKYGIAETSVFSDLPKSNDRSLGKSSYTDAVRENALKHRIQSEDLDPSSRIELITCCLTNITTGIGSHDWSHSTMGPVKLTWIETGRPFDPFKNVGLIELNNWGDWNDPRYKAQHGFYEVWPGGPHQPNEAYAFYSIM